MDLALLQLFNQDLVHPLLDGLMIGLTTVGFAILPGLGIILVLDKQHKRTGITILISLVVGLIIVLGLQYLTARPRPETVRLLMPTPNFPSYPSGHASAAFGVAVIVGLAYRKAHWWLIALAGASLVAFSRIYLGVHYPSDMLGGVILGAAIGSACYGIFWLPGSNWRWLLWPQIAIVAIVSHMAYLNILPLYLLDWPLSDKVFHFLLFGAVVFWLNLWLQGRKMQIGPWLVPIAILVPFTLAIVEELSQQLSPFRTADVTDLLSDLIGMLFFWWLSNKFVDAEPYSSRHFLENNP